MSVANIIQLWVRDQRASLLREQNWSNQVSLLEQVCGSLTCSRACPLSLELTMAVLRTRVCVLRVCIMCVQEVAALKSQVVHTKKQLKESKRAEAMHSAAGECAAMRAVVSRTRSTSELAL